METNEKQKSCGCSTPTTAQAVLLGYVGKLTCSKCGGIFNWPLPEKKYEGSDSVEELLFNMSRDKNSLTMETAILTMLIRIERLLKKESKKG
jgi:hypothetical protein